MYTKLAPYSYHLWQPMVVVLKKERGVFLFFLVGGGGGGGVNILVLSGTIYGKCSALLFVLFAL